MKHILLSISIELYNEIEKIANDETSEFSATAKRIIKGNVRIWMDDELDNISMKVWGGLAEKDDYLTYIKGLNIGAQLKANVANVAQ